MDPKGLSFSEVFHREFKENGQLADMKIEHIHRRLKEIGPGGNRLHKTSF